MGSLRDNWVLDRFVTDRWIRDRVIKLKPREFRGINRLERSQGGGGIGLRVTWYCFNSCSEEVQDVIQKWQVRATEGPCSWDDVVMVCMWVAAQQDCPHLNFRPSVFAWTFSPFLSSVCHYIFWIFRLKTVVKSEILLYVAVFNSSDPRKQGVCLYVV